MDLPNSRPSYEDSLWDAIETPITTHLSPPLPLPSYLFGDSVSPYLGDAVRSLSPEPFFRGDAVRPLSPEPFPLGDAVPSRSPDLVRSLSPSLFTLGDAVGSRSSDPIGSLSPNPFPLGDAVRSRSPDPVGRLSPGPFPLGDTFESMWPDPFPLGDSEREVSEPYFETVVPETPPLTPETVVPDTPLPPSESTISETPLPTLDLSPRLLEFLAIFCPSVKTIYRSVVSMSSMKMLSSESSWCISILFQMHFNIGLCCDVLGAYLIECSCDGLAGWIVSNPYIVRLDAL